MIKPTVGRIVHYFPAMLDEGIKPEPGSPLAAIITRVWTDTCINITYFDANGVAFGKTSVLLVHDDQQPAPDGAYVAWMPYQKGQAAKTEAVQREAVNSVLDARIPILDQISDLCYAIEKCGASPELTDAVTKASALREPISKLVRRAIALGIDGGLMSVSHSEPEVKTEALEEAAESCTQKVADDTSDLVRLILKPGTTLKINGLPVQLVGEAMVAAHPSNVPMMFCKPGEAKSDQDRSLGN